VITVLVVEDELVAAEALVRAVDRLPGFEVAGHLHTGAEALHRLATEPVDLVLLDIYLPDMSGIELLRRLRGAGNTVDVIAVTRAQDLAVVHAAVAFGVLQYLVKPFTFGTVRQRLQRYRTYRAKTSDHRMVLLQQDIDGLQRTLRVTDQGDLPKGISHESLEAVIAALRECGEAGVSADELAHRLGASRITARRYLEYLVDSGQV
jgi:response regulator of citrate/malate metabolism